jgi:hypothetical protein
MESSTTNLHLLSWPNNDIPRTYLSAVEILAYAYFLGSQHYLYRLLATTYTLSLTTIFLVHISGRIL